MSYSTGCGSVLGPRSSCPLAEHLCILCHVPDIVPSPRGAEGNNRHHPYSLSRTLNRGEKKHPTQEQIAYVIPCPVMRGVLKTKTGRGGVGTIRMKGRAVT